MRLKDFILRSEEFVCKNCGSCCLEIPCVISQFTYGIDPHSGELCPSLTEIAEGKYTCLLIETDPSAREVLVGNGCDLISQRHLKPKINAFEIARQYFPEAGDEEIEIILWEYTSFPEFWQIPRCFG